jgi:hypothetical protein
MIAFIAARVFTQPGPIAACRYASSNAAIPYSVFIERGGAMIVTGPASSGESGVLDFRERCYRLVREETSIVRRLMEALKFFARLSNGGSARFIWLAPHDSNSDIDSMDIVSLLSCKIRISCLIFDLTLSGYNMCCANSRH